MSIRGERRTWVAALLPALVVAACTATPVPSSAAPAVPAPSPSPAVPAPSPSPSGAAALPSRTPPAATQTAPPSAGATADPLDPSALRVRFEPVATVPGRLLAIANAGDGSDRLFVAEQGGKVFVIAGGEVVPAPFLDLTGKVSLGGEQGLLGLAFHPDFPTDDRIFVDYTDVAGNSVVASFRVDPGAPDAAVAGSEVVILTVAQPYANHNGGGIAFGPDGYLYVALGDGGSANDPHGNGQRLSTLLGKILRIDVDGPADGLTYRIPDSNPFAGTSGARGEIWLLGLRNPFRFSFDRTTGDLWIGDVGQGEWEEIDVARAGVGGLNFGWRTMEGAHCFAPASGCRTAGLALPVTEYAHDLGCAVIGGNVYRGSDFPALRGAYLFSDSCTGSAWMIDAATNGPTPPIRVGESSGSIAGYGEDEAGELYAASLDGQIFRVVAVTR